MATTLCDICGVRPATVQATVVQDGQRRTLNLCEVDYARLVRQSRQASPLERLFQGGMLDDFLATSAEASSATSVPVGAARHSPARTGLRVRPWI